MSAPRSALNSRLNQSAKRGQIGLERCSAEDGVVGEAEEGI